MSGMNPRNRCFEPSSKACALFYSRVQVGTLALTRYDAFMHSPHLRLPRVAIALILLTSGQVSLASAQNAVADPPAAATMAPAKGDRFLTPEKVQTLADAFVEAYKVDGKLAPIPTASNDFERIINKQLGEVSSPVIAAAAKQDAKTDEKESLWSFASVLGPKFTASNCPDIKAFMDTAFTDAKRVNSATKKQFNRPRPFEEDPQNLKSNPSFPSGHSTTAGLRYRLLTAITEADPTDEIALFKQGWFMCFERLAVNVHYPSDVAAGFVLGEMIADAVLKDASENPEGPAAKALAKARDEWKRLK